MAQQGAGKLVFLDNPFTYEPLAWAIRKDDSDFMNWLNNFLNQIKNDGRYDKIYSKWIKSTDWIKEVQQGPLAQPELTEVEDVPDPFSRVLQYLERRQLAV